MSVQSIIVKCRRNCQRGFTLLELLVVMVIIGLLSAFVGPRLFGQIGKSETKIAKAQIESLVKALDQYRLDAGHCPATDQGLPALMANPGEAHWAGPYLAKALPQDPWARDYLYRSPGEHSDCDVWSYGRDGTPGGEGEDADISSW
jgi:general secretion pathway protein G